MTERLCTVTQSTPVEDALAAMQSQGVRRLPVVDEDGRLAGVVSLDDVLDQLAEEFGELRRLLKRHSPQCP